MASTCKKAFRCGRSVVASSERHAQRKAIPNEVFAGTSRHEFGVPIRDAGADVVRRPQFVRLRNLGQSEPQRSAFAAVALVEETTHARMFVTLSSMLTAGATSHRNDDGGL